jgi:hypothetical protein
MKKIPFKTNTTRVYRSNHNRSRSSRKRKVGYSIGPVKVWAEGKDAGTDLLESTIIGVGAFGFCIGIILLAKKKLIGWGSKADEKLVKAKTTSKIEVVKTSSEIRREASEQAQRQAEQEDPESKLKQNDKEVKKVVFENLGLDNIEDLQGERVYPSDPATKRKRSPLVGSLVSKGDLCVLVSNPGVGKSALAYYMADCIADGKETLLFPTSEGHQPPQKVHYFDFEMDSDDMRERYPQGLSGNLNRIPVSMPRRTVYYLLNDIVEIVGEITSDATLFIDNVAAATNEKDAKTLLVGLKKIQAMFVERGFRLTVIIVVHTTKEAKNEPDLDDVAGAADLTRFAKTVIFLTPTSHEGVVRLHDGKRRTTKKNQDRYIKVMGGVGMNENLHFESVFRVLEEEKAQKLTDELNDDTPKESGRPQLLSEEDARTIAERLDAGEKAEDLSEEFGVCKNTITGRARPYRKGKK